MDLPTDFVGATERALHHTFETAEILFRLPERPASRWHRAGLGRRGERVFDITAGLVMAIFTIGWTWAISQSRIDDLEGTGPFDAVTPVTASIDAALTDPDATSAAYLTDAALALVAPTRGESGKLRAVFKAPGSKVALAGDTLPDGAQITYRNGAIAETTAVAAPTTPSTSGIWQMVVKAGDAIKQVSDFSVITLTPFTEKRGGRIGFYYIGNWPGERGRARPGYTHPSGFIQVTASNETTAVSDHFKLSDFLPHDQPNVWPKYIVLEPRELDKLELVLTDLQEHGINPAGVRVLSGFRTPQYNYHGGDTRGRAALSRHMYGDAADIFIDNDHDGQMDDLNHDGRVNMQDARVIMNAVDRVERAHPALVGGCGVYPAESGHGPFTHIDARGYHARWVGMGDS